MMHISTDDTQICSHDCILESKHLWVKTQDITVHPSIEDVGGISGFYRPPIAAPSLLIKMLLNGLMVRPSDFVWSVECFERSAQVQGLFVRTYLVPVRGYGYIEKLVVLNSDTEPRVVKFDFDIHGGFENLSSGKWGWVPPASSALASFEAKPDRLVALCAGESLYFQCDVSAVYSDNTISTSVHVDASSEVAFYISCCLSTESESVDLAALYVGAIEDNRRSFESTIAAFPALTSSNKQLETFYNKGLVSFHTCIWESDSFVYSPFMAESGIDGGAVCNYPWGIAYICKLLAVGHPELLKQHIVQILKTDLRHHYAYTPLDGRPVGPWYSYNQYSIIACTFHYVNTTNDIAFLHEYVNGKSVFEHLKDNAWFGDDLSKPVSLIDYGTNENLLELKRTTDYEHYVPSPNAERCWSYRAVADLGQRIGESTGQLTRRADELKDYIVNQLWDSESGWLTSRDLDDNRRPGWSIQVFDTLRTGILNLDQANALVMHLNDNEFLSDYGVHSLSKQDPGYDIRDVDWGGPGVYSGDGPELVEDLYLSGQFDRGDDVLRRIIWWGERLPYYPQAMIADAIDYRRDGRANIIAGLKVNECLVFGLLGLTIEYGISASIKPHLPSFLEDYCFDSLRLGERNIRVEVSKEGYLLCINGKTDPQLYPLGHLLEIHL